MSNGRVIKVCVAGKSSSAMLNTSTAVSN